MGSMENASTWLILLKIQANIFELIYINIDKHKN